MKDAHLAVGVLAITVNAVAAVYGTWCWRRAESAVWFWRVLRTGQAVVVLQIALGGVLLLTGHKPAHLHVLYGLLPLLVSFIAEPLRASSAQMILDARGFESAQAVGRLPEDEQRAIVLAIIQREVGLMALAAWVVVILLLRAAQTAG
jgi:hypothetical protein